MAKAIPAGYHTLTPSFTFKDSKKAIDFYKKAFGAKLLDFMPNLDGKGIMHASMQIGNSVFMFGDEMGENCQSAETIGASPISLFVYVADADKAFAKAVKAGAEVVMPMADMFWGDRSGTLLDPFGYQWMIATHKKDLTKKQIKDGAVKFFAEMEKAN